MKLKQADWWTWANALQTLAPNDGAIATGLAWSTYCWNWRKGALEADVLGKGLAMPIEKFVAQHRPRAGNRTVRRHFAELQACGLLLRQRGHSRFGPDVYVPRVPEGWPAVDDGPANSGHQWPVLEGPEQWPPVASAAQQRPQVASVEGSNSGHQATRTVAISDIAPSSPEVVQTPLARTHTREGAREGTDGGGEGRSSQDDEHATTALVQLLDALPAEVSRRVAPGYRSQIQPRVLELTEQGWVLADVVQAVSEGGWEGAKSVGALLNWRLEQLPAPAPAAPVVRRPEWCGRCEETTRQVETERGMARCTDCHPLELRAAAVPA